MAARGAKHLLILSRSGESARNASKLQADLKSMGTIVHAPACDIGDESALQGVLEEYCLTGPPIRGCVHGAMVLQVRSSVKSTSVKLTIPSRTKSSKT